MDVGVVGFPVVGVLILIGGGPVGQFARDGVLVGLREVALSARPATLPLGSQGDSLHPVNRFSKASQYAA